MTRMSPAPRWWKALIACLLALLTTAACAAGDARHGGSHSLTVINGADGPLCSLRIKRASSQTFWGRNRLRSGQRLAPGASLEIDGLAAGRYDVDAYLCDDDTHPGFGDYDVAVGPDAAAVWVVGQSWRTDISELSQFINLPAQPAQAQWQAGDKGAPGDATGPTDTELIAVLQFDQNILQELQSRLTPQTSPAELFVASDFVQPWFPEPVRQLFVVDPAYPAYLKLAGTRYQPSLFAKGSLNNGYVVIVDGFALVYLHTK